MQNKKVSKMEELKQIEEAIQRLESKDFGLYFFVLDTKGNPTAGIANIYEHVKVLNELGYRATILHDKNDYHGVGDWLGEEYANLPHVSIESQQLKVTGTDFIIIPEIFSNVMDQVKTFPCKKIVFSQSYHYALDLLPIGKRWADFGFTEAITTSDKQANYLKSIFPNLKTNVIPVSIPSYFKPTNKIKEPIVVIASREQGEAVKLVKSFYLQYPTYKFVTFKELRGIPRRTFAEEMGRACLAVWIDDTAGFGTLPIEAMECDTPVIGKIPNMIPEWMEESSQNNEIFVKENGVWTNNLLNIPELIAQYMKVWFEDSVPESLIQGMRESTGQYTEEKQRAAIETVYANIISNRKEDFTRMLEAVTQSQETNTENNG